jgi:hypothetical protein
MEGFWRGPVGLAMSSFLGLVEPTSKRLWSNIVWKGSIAPFFWMHVSRGSNEMSSVKSRAVVEREAVVEGDVVITTEGCFVDASAVLFGLMRNHEVMSKAFAMLRPSMVARPIAGKPAGLFMMV